MSNLGQNLVQRSGIIPQAKHETLVLFRTSSGRGESRPVGLKGMAMKTARTQTGGFHDSLERKQAELVQVLRKREHITIETSADQMDEIQYASERDMAIQNVDRESTLLRDVRAALRRIQDGIFGTCIDCESAISPKRLAAVSWAPRCIQCQEGADRDGQERTDLINAA
jgi:DnaK suppressor protein